MIEREVHLKLAMLMLCHKSPEQVNMLTRQMKHPDIDFFIHIDKKQHFDSEIETDSYIHILPEQYRVNCKWATFSLVQAELNLLHYASETGHYDYYWFCSGQDFPIKPTRYIVDFLSSYPDKNFIDLRSSENWGGCRNNLDKRNDIYYPTFLFGRSNGKRLLKRAYVEITGGYNRTFRPFKRTYRFKSYFGSQWCCLSGNTVSWILRFLSRHPGYIEFFKHCSTPDESFFQTLVMNGPYKNKREDYLHYIDWSEEKSSPKVLCIEDLEKLKSSSKLMARKFDVDVDRSVLERLMA